MDTIRKIFNRRIFLATLNVHPNFTTIKRQVIKKRIKFGKEEFTLLIIQGFRLYSNQKKRNSILDDVVGSHLTHFCNFMYFYQRDYNTIYCNLFDFSS